MKWFRTYLLKPLTFNVSVCFSTIFNANLCRIGSSSPSFSNFDGQVCITWWFLHMSQDIFIEKVERGPTLSLKNYNGSPILLWWTDITLSWRVEWFHPSWIHSTIGYTINQAYLLCDIQYSLITKWTFQEPSRYILYSTNKLLNKLMEDQNIEIKFLTFSHLGDIDL
jgi:hypothetical protein